MMKIKILHLYPDLLNLYGDMGNIECLKHRLIWRGIDVEVIAHPSDAGEFDVADIDIIVLGGGGDAEEKKVMQMLAVQKDKLIDYVNSEGTLFATCGGMDMLGKYCVFGKETVDGPGVLDIYTENSKKRMTGDVVLDSEVFNGKIVGFENRGRRTVIGANTPLGRVCEGGGNNGDDKKEGVVYKNVIATHLHGPVLPKNPQLCDYILECELQKKYKEFAKLSPLADELEKKANEFIVKRYSK
ncbi:MAG: glutamine amidotransferase [Clostridia bacterium]|nr:glutamine amidotransferase [Clostridia bacterium]